MAMVEYYAAEIPARGFGNAAEIKVATDGETVFLRTTLLPQNNEETGVEFSKSEAKALIEGMRDALVGRCGVTHASWNKYCDSLKITPSR